MNVKKVALGAVALFAMGWMLSACETTAIDSSDTRTPAAAFTPASAPTSNVPGCAPPYPSGVPTAATVFCADPSAMEHAEVVRIIDGDTLVVTIDGREETVRIFGIDTPERGDDCFAAASDRLRALASTDVRLLPSVRERDRNGRLLRYVYTPDGTSVDATLVAEGFALAWRRDGALRFAIVDLETLAAAFGRGCLWGPGAS